MTKTFESLPEIASALRNTVDAVFEARGQRTSITSSAQSCSSYVTIDYTSDDGMECTEVTLRFSDHADRHGSDFTGRVDEIAVETENGFAVEATDFDALVQKAVAFADAFAAEYFAL